MNAQLKALLFIVINMAVNGTLWTILPAEYKAYAIVAVNLIQVAIAFYDPSYTIQKLGWTKQTYLGAVARNKAEKVD